jgi:hypothetical protein
MAEARGSGGRIPNSGLCAESRSSFHRDVMPAQEVTNRAGYVRLIDIGGVQMAAADFDERLLT